MSKWIVVFLLLMSPLSAEFQGSVAFRSAAFFHDSTRFDHIYGNVGGSYQLEATLPLYNQLVGWTNLDWFSRHGRSEGLHDPTRVNILNFSFGVKVFQPLYENLFGYAGIGLSFSEIWLKNKSHCIHERTSKGAFGGVLKAGAYYFISDQVFLDTFVDYLYQPVHFDTQIDIGGVKTGLGIGYMF